MVFAVVETTVSTVATKKAGKWYRGVLYAVGRFVAVQRKDEADLPSRQRHASVVGVALGDGKGVGNNRKANTVYESRKKTADRVARYQPDYRSQTSAVPSNKCDAVVLCFFYIYI